MCGLGGSRVRSRFKNNIRHVALYCKKNLTVEFLSVT